MSFNERKIHNPNSDFTTETLSFKKTVNIADYSIDLSKVVRSLNDSAFNDFSNTMSLFNKMTLENFNEPLRMMSKQISESFESNIKIMNEDALKNLKLSLSVNIPNFDNLTKLVNFNFEKILLTENLNPKYAEIFKAGKTLEYYSRVISNTNEVIVENESCMTNNDTVSPVPNAPVEITTVKSFSIQNYSIYIKFLLSIIIYFSLLLPVLESYEYKELINNLPNYEITHIPFVESIELLIGGLLIFEKDNPIISIIIRLIFIQIKKGVSGNHNLVFPNMLEAERLVKKVIEQLTFENPANKDILKHICISNLCVITRNKTKIKSRYTAKSKDNYIACKNQLVAINAKNKKWAEIFYFNEDKLENGWIQSKYLRKYIV